MSKSEPHLNLIRAEKAGGKPVGPIWWDLAGPFVAMGLVGRAEVESLLGPEPPRPPEVRGKGVIALLAGKSRKARKFDCIHLGLVPTVKEERLCESCRGNVRVKIYHCGHPEIGETTPSQCQNCLAYKSPKARMAEESGVSPPPTPGETDGEFEAGGS